MIASQPLHQIYSLNSVNSLNSINDLQIVQNVMFGILGRISMAFNLFTFHFGLTYRDIDT